MQHMQSSPRLAVTKGRKASLMFINVPGGPADLICTLKSLCRSRRPGLGLLLPPRRHE